VSGGYGDGEGLREIVEVVEAGMRRANEYLAAGYRLITVQKLQRYRNDRSGSETFTGYVLGRTEETPHVDLPYEEPAQTAAVA